MNVDNSALGLLQVYTGPGKGKTTAAVGLAARAAGQGLAVAFIQFAKPDESGEVDSLRKLGVKVSHFGAKGFLVPDSDPTPHREAALRGWSEGLRYLKGEEQVDLLVLDELCQVLSLGLLDRGEVMEAIINRPHGLEVVCTGRDAPKELIQAADLVTEMLETKHYFKKGVKGRKGIEY
ncbi:cob(I)yrinic acid a,c-diamide adenosyltransferase [candidate division TA06 bacterium B3_TA06]|uniref:Cob(I)yrinic acid a,c-diamide adenosyltransferase n=1 Tax=candidate division TA06 bacterium B3_TA06 TaxID=2012487 RepID=A0A532V8D5_UNCT6|nr:MAG: cob(I)yrinic acid a,c-diamide adenosyltransferase [candidate division TA06 bacterium B3_TA06]